MKSIRLPSIRRQGHSAPIAFCAVLGLTAIACACNVPVFRFALERWRPDVYRVTLLHRGPLSEAQREMSRPLEEAQEKGSANFVLQVVDVSELEKPTEHNQGPLAETLSGAWSRIGMGEAWLIVQYPALVRVDVPVWSGPLASEAVTRLTGSPIRQVLVRRLSEGQSVVWLLLESGIEAMDNAAAELLEGELGELQRSLKLPELTADPDDELLAKTPLKLAFTVLRVPKSTAAEEALVGMLVHCESDLSERSDPLAFPVFGRGRALLPLVGRGINAKNIQDASEFLVGACSCQVKEQNPGFDLLLSSNWDSLLPPGSQGFAAMQTRETSAANGTAELVPIPTGSQPAAALPGESPASSASASNASLISVAVLFGIAAFVFLLASLHAGKS